MARERTSDTGGAGNPEGDSGEVLDGASARVPEGGDNGDLKLRLREGEINWKKRDPMAGAVGWLGTDRWVSRKRRG